MTKRKRSGPKSRPIRRVIANRNVPLPGQWDCLITLLENKSDLTDFLSHELMSMAKSVAEPKEVAEEAPVEAPQIGHCWRFQGNERVTATSDRDVSHLESNQEEADTRILLHAADAGQSGFQRVVVASHDADVIVLLIHFRRSLPREVWVRTGTSKKCCFIAIHDISFPLP